MVVFLGEGYALWRGVVGLCPGCPDGGGGGGKGVGAPSSLSPASPEGDYRVLPWSDLMIRVGRPWNLLLMWVGPGPPRLSIYMLVLLTRLLFNPHTAYSDVGGTIIMQLFFPAVYLLRLMPVCVGFIMVSCLFLLFPLITSGVSLNRAECKAACRLHLIILNRRNISIK
jgi:hypothetical protein